MVWKMYLRLQIWRHFGYLVIKCWAGGNRFGKKKDFLIAQAMHIYVYTYIYIYILYIEYCLFSVPALTCLHVVYICRYMSRESFGCELRDICRYTNASSIEAYHGSCAGRMTGQSL